MLFVTLVHHAKAIGRHEMPFGTDTRVVQLYIHLYSPHTGSKKEKQTIVLDRGLGPPTGSRDFVVGHRVCSNAAYCHITSAIVFLCCLYLTDFK